MHLLVLRYGFLLLLLLSFFLPIRVCMNIWIRCVSFGFAVMLFLIFGLFLAYNSMSFLQLVLNVCVRVCRLFVAFNLQFLYEKKEITKKQKIKSSLVYKNVLKPIVRYPVALFSSRYSIVGKKTHMPYTLRYIHTGCMEH